MNFYKIYFCFFARFACEARRAFFRHRRISLWLMLSCFLVFLIPGDIDVNASKNHKINGWAWSENIGWVSLNCYNSGLINKCLNSDYGVDYDKNSKEVFGWAWSEYGGWLCFGKSCITAGLNATPDNDFPKVEINEHGLLLGWANWTVLEDKGWLKLLGDSKDIPGEKFSCKNCASLKGDIKERCGICFTNEEFGGSKEICSDCYACQNSICDDCVSCYKYGAGIDFSNNTLIGWAWNNDTNVGFGWLKFHPAPSLIKVHAPYLETIGGDIYAKEGIGSLYQPIAPEGKYNATFMLQSNGDIIHFTSECEETGKCEPASGWISEDIGELELPKKELVYRSNIGTLDIKGLLAGQHGEVKLSNNTRFLGSILDGKIYYSDGNFTAGTFTALNAEGEQSGAGTIIVKGNLIIKGNIKYQSGPVSKLKNLASLGWLVLQKDDGTGGNIYIDPTVEKIAGSFYAENYIYTGSKVSGQDVPLRVDGLMIAKGFNFQRNFMDIEIQEPAERIIYDGRVISNPPPGFVDIAKALPVWE